MDSFETFKALQKEGWANFASLEMMTTISAARLVKFAGVAAGHDVLDVACGTGVVAITAARKRAKVTGIDLTPQLLEQAGHNSRIAEVQVDWREADVENLPFSDGCFDVVLSQFGHIFAPRPAVTVAEMLRVLKPGGTIAFSTWPPDLFMGRMFSLIAGYMPPAMPGVSPPNQWGDYEIVRAAPGNCCKRRYVRSGHDSYAGFERSALSNYCRTRRGACYQNRADPFSRGPGEARCFSPRLRRAYDAVLR